MAHRSLMLAAMAVRGLMGEEKVYGRWFKALSTCREQHETRLRRRAVAPMPGREACAARRPSAIHADGGDEVGQLVG